MIEWDTLNHMPGQQRSFRLSETTVALLDEAAEQTSESRNALADRLLGEALRLEQHPLIRFNQGAGGRRQPAIVGTRIYVHQAVSTVGAGGGDVDDAAAYLSVPPRLVRAALDYYADFREEVDLDLQTARRLEEEERSRWERRQHALA